MAPASGPLCAPGSPGPPPGAASCRSRRSRTVPVSDLIYDGARRRGWRARLRPVSQGLLGRQSPAQWRPLAGPAARPQRSSAVAASITAPPVSASPAAKTASSFSGQKDSWQPHVRRPPLLLWGPAAGLGVRRWPGRPSQPGSVRDRQGCPLSAAPFSQLRREATVGPVLGSPQPLPETPGCHPQCALCPQSPGRRPPGGRAVGPAMPHVMPCGTGRPARLLLSGTEEVWPLGGWPCSCWGEVHAFAA